MYFYEIKVYHPFYENDKIVMWHDECFDNHQLNIIVQEAFDECIEKYIDKPVLDKGEEACRIEVGTIFEKHLPSQLKNHGFKNIKINETCSILGGTLFCDNGVNNPVLMDKYKNEVLPPCKKCIRKEYVGYVEKCIVPNTRKDTSLPTTRVVKTIPINLNEKETDETNIKTLKGAEDDEKTSNDYFNTEIIKLYYDDPEKTNYKAQKAIEAFGSILTNNDCGGFWAEFNSGDDNFIRQWDISCDFEDINDKEKFLKLFTSYEFAIEETKKGFWITGV